MLVADDIFATYKMLAIYEIAIKLDDKLIEKYIKPKIGKLSKDTKLFKSQKLKSEKLAKSKKLSKSENLPKFATKKARPNFLISDIKTAFNHL